MHCPSRQASFSVQTSPSSQGVSSGWGSNMQPSSSLQVPAAQSSAWLEQSRALPSPQLPLSQVSPVVQNMPSSQGEPSSVSASSQSYEPAAMRVTSTLAGSSAATVTSVQPARTASPEKFTPST